MARNTVRTAYTLIELVVVMAIIVMISAVAYPSLEDSYDHFKVTGAADAVKGRLGRGPRRAIEDCMPYRFADPARHVALPCGSRQARVLDGGVRRSRPTAETGRRSFTKALSPRVCCSIPTATARRPTVGARKTTRTMRGHAGRFVGVGEQGRIPPDRGSPGRLRTDAEKVERPAHRLATAGADRYCQNDHYQGEPLIPPSQQADGPAGPVAAGSADRGRHLLAGDWRHHSARHLGE